MSLFKVQTRRYKTYYVIARGYDEAVKKVEIQHIKDNAKSILTEDGSLNNSEEEKDYINSIDFLTDDLIT